MKRIIPIIMFAAFLFIEPGCKEEVADVIDCTVESTFLSIDAEINVINPKLIHFEFVNKDKTGGFTLDSNINWDFGDGNNATSTNHKTDHIYADTGNYIVIATYVLRSENARCNGSIEKNLTID